MKTINQLIVLSGVAAFLCLGTNQVVAQGRGGPPGGKGGFDPTQFRQQGLERLRESFDVKDDAEWKIIEERVVKVYEVQLESLGSRFGGMRAFGRGGLGGGDTQGGSTQGRGPGGAANPEAGALQKALEAKSSNETLKLRMEKFREARKASEAKLLDAQEALKQVLSVRQEAIALQLGLVN